MEFFFFGQQKLRNLIVFNTHPVHLHKVLTFELGCVVAWLNFVALPSKMYFTWMNY